MWRLTWPAIVPTVVVLGGCSAKGPDLLESQYAELLARPDIETIVQRYEEMRVKITDRLTTAGFASTWNAVPDSAGTRSCLPAYSQLETEAEEWSLRLWESKGG